MIHWSFQGASSPGTVPCGRGEESLSFAERTRFAGFRVQRRRADWLLGRVTAKRAVAAALDLPNDRPLRSIEIPSESNGMPYARIAPEAERLAGFAPGERLPLSVSISHFDGHALCAAIRWKPREVGSRRTLGIDLGPVEGRSQAFLGTFLTEDEQRSVRDAPAWKRGMRANLIWCAKEAVLKALGLGLTVDTRDLNCLPEAGLPDPAEWSMAPADDGWRPFVATLGPGLAPGVGTIRGIWRSLARFVGALAFHATPAALSSQKVSSRRPGTRWIELPENV